MKKNELKIEFHYLMLTMLLVTIATIFDIKYMLYFLLGTYLLYNNIKVSTNFIGAKLERRNLIVLYRFLSIALCVLGVGLLTWKTPQAIKAYIFFVTGYMIFKYVAVFKLRRRDNYDTI